jgi:hypothetical protein
MSPRRLRHLAGVTACLTAFALSAACSGGKPVARSTASTTSSPSTSSAAPSPTPTPVGTALTGGPVLAVKIDNTSAARPRIALDQADIIYVEPVEGGLTRLLVVYSRHLPTEVGPVRSGRESDRDLLANYGRVALAYSGASLYTLQVLAQGKQVNVVYDAGTRGFHRDHSRPAPYNVIGNSRELLARAGGSVKPSDIGFRYGPAAPGGVAGSSVSAAWPSSRVSLAWNAQRKRYLVTTDGRPDVSPAGAQYGASTVVVQYVRTHASTNRDVNGQPTPVAEVVGGGKATVLRDGKVWQGTWQRPAAAAPTSFTAGGQPITFAPAGTVWVLLVAAGQPVTVR